MGSCPEENARKIPLGEASAPTEQDNQRLYKIYGENAGSDNYIFIIITYLFTNLLVIR